MQAAPAAPAASTPFRIQGAPLTAERFRAILGKSLSLEHAVAHADPCCCSRLAERVAALRGKGESEESSVELRNLVKVVYALQSHNQQNQLRAAQLAAQQQRKESSLASAPSPELTLVPPLDTEAAATAASTSTLAKVNGDLTPPAPPRSPPIVSFTPEQLASLKCQIMAFKLLSRNQPIPPNIQAAVFTPSEALKLIAGTEQRPGNTSRDSDGVNGAGSTAISAEAAQAIEAAREKLLAAEAPLEEVEDPDSLVYPYNAFLSPVSVLHSSQGAPVRRTLFIPNLLPTGLDPQAIADERNRFIDARVQQRVSELEALPSTLAQDDYDYDGPSSERNVSLASQKLKALIELKSLNLLARQKALREDVVRGFNQAASLALPIDRASFRRSKKQTLRDARLTEQLERKQKAERERRAKQKHLDHLAEITTHGRDLNAAHRAHQAKFAKLGKALLKFHADAEKDEQRRVERVSKERLKALRADDEEGYLKLIDTAKDTRITHLLRQTDAFLESLATAVVAQQNDAVHAENPLAPAEVVPEPMQVDGDEAVDESRFGAVPVFEEEAKDKVDYYNVAHRIKETITEQPKILVGGQLKSYQIKGLEWMISLYNNHVNGILADEMVRFRFVSRGTCGRELTLFSFALV